MATARFVSDCSSILHFFNLTNAVDKLGWTINATEWCCNATGISCVEKDDIVYVSEINLSGQGIYGNLSKPLNPFELPFLSHVQMSNNNFNGSLEIFSYFTALETFSVMDSGLTGNLASLNQLTKLKLRKIE